jgi:hypothetical protein
MKNYKYTIHYALIAALLLFASACSKDDNQGPTLTAKQLTREQRLDSIIHSKTGLNPTIMVDSIEVMGTFGMKVIDTTLKFNFDSMINGRDRNAYMWGAKVGEIERQNPNRDKYALFFPVKRSISIQVNDSNRLIGLDQNDTMFVMNFTEYRICSRFFNTDDELNFATFKAFKSYKSPDYKMFKHTYDSVWNAFEMHKIPYPLNKIRNNLDKEYVYNPIGFLEQLYGDMYWLEYGDGGLLMKLAFKAGSNRNLLPLHQVFFLEPSEFREFNVKTELLNDGKLHKVLYLTMPYENEINNIKNVRLRYVLN